MVGCDCQLDTLADVSRGNEATVTIEEEVELLKMRETRE
jgi:hypothetical protein